MSGPKHLKEAIRELSANPLFGRNLKIDSDGLRSYRVGSFRIVYRMTGAVMEIISVDHREDVYR